MKPETKIPPELKPDDLVQFVENHRPRLKAGDYTISVKQSLEIDAKNTHSFPSQKLDFTVKGERLSLGDENFHAIFPPPGARGKFGHVLPHVILNRSTLPWERSPLGGTEVDPDSPSWLALLLFTEDDAANLSAENVQKKSAPGTEGLANAQEPARDPIDFAKSKLTTAGALRNESAKFPEDFKPESGQHASDRVSVIEVPWGLLKTLLPNYHDLGVTAHVRRVGKNTGQSAAGNELVVIPAAPPDNDNDDPAIKDEPAADAPVDNWDPLGQELALIICNRLPPEDKTCVAHLVSLEERFWYPEHFESLTDPNLLRSPLTLQHEQLSEWLSQARRKQEADQTFHPYELRLVAGEKPKRGPVNKGIADLSDLPESEHLGATEVHKMCHAMLGGEDSVWSKQLKQMGEVKFTATFTSKNDSVGRIAVEIFHEGWEPVETLEELISRISLKQGYQRYRVDADVLENLKIAGADPTVLVKLKSKAIKNRTFEGTEKDFVEKHLKAVAGLTSGELDAKLDGDSGNLTEDQINDLIHQVPPIAGSKGSGVKLEFLGYQRYRVDADVLENLKIAGADPTVLVKLKSKAIKNRTFEGTEKDFVEKHLKAVAGLTSGELDAKLDGDSGETLQELISRISLKQGSNATPLSDDKTRRLANWIEFQVRDQLFAERTTLLKPVPQSKTGDIPKMTLANLLKNRQSDVLAKAWVEKADLDKVQPGKPHKPKGWLGEHPQMEIDTRGFRLGVTLKPDSSGSGVTATLSRKDKLLAGRFRLLKPEPVFDEQKATDENKIRLVSLKSWKFHCEAEKRGFTEELTGLNSSNAEIAEFHVPLPDEEAQEAAIAQVQPTPSASILGAIRVSLHEGRRYLRSGAVALRHGLRGGGRTFSWYHGPFISDARAQAKLRLPARGPDELLIYNEALGMFDVSYAAAWELGRLTVLEDNHFAMMLFHWKRDHSRTLAHLRQKMDHNYLPLVRQTPDMAPPDCLATCFRSLTLLEDAPFNYLVPDERLLPTESIRFFTVDSMWLECLRDGAFSVGRVLAKDHLDDTARSKDLEPPPRLSGFLLRSKVVSDWQQLAVDGYTDVDRDSAALENEPNPPYPKLTLERFDRLGPNVLLCLFSDPNRMGREIEMVDIHLPPEVLHFGLEEDKHKNLMKQLRNPRSGEHLNQWLWLGGGDRGANQKPGYRVDGVTLENLRIAGVDSNVLRKLKSIENQTFECTAEEFVQKHLRPDKPPGDKPQDWTGLTSDELESTVPANPAETVRQLILRSSGPFQIKNQTVESIPFRSPDDHKHKVIDLTALYDEVANRLAPVLPPNHRFTAADFSLQMLDLPPLVRFVRPTKSEVKS